MRFPRRQRAANLASGGARFWASWRVFWWTAVRRRSSLAGGAHRGGAAEGGGRIAARYGDERDAAGDRALRGGVAGSQPGVRSAGVASAAEKAGRFLRGPVPAAGRDEFRRFQPGGESGLPA